MRKLWEINDYLLTNNGIFKTIYNLNQFSWLSNNDADTLDLEYYLNHSGEKYISPLVNKLYEFDISTYLSKLASVIILKFKDKWNKLYDAFINSEYNPIENYSMVEDEKVGSKMKVSSDNNTFGFNTIETNGVGASKIETETSGEFDDNHRQLKRSGNIGVTTSQQMLLSEIELRKWNFYNMIMDDIDTIMCLAYRGI